MRHYCVPLVVSGVVFTIFAVAHILRLAFHWTIVLDGMIVSELVSVIAIIVSGALAIWMFSASVCKNKK